MRRRSRQRRYGMTGGLDVSVQMKTNALSDLDGARCAVRIVGNHNRFVDAGERGPLGMKVSGEGTWIRRLQHG